MHREFDAEITEQIPDGRVAWTTIAGQARQAGAVTFHRLDEGSSQGTRETHIEMIMGRESAFSWFKMPAKGAMT